MLSFNRFLNAVTTTTLESVLSVTVSQETGTVFYVFSGTWGAFDTAKKQILRYLKNHLDIITIWIAIDNDCDLTKRQMPFTIQWVGLCSDGHYEVEVWGQQSHRIAQKWSSILTKTLGGDVTLFWAQQGGEDD